MSSQVEIHIRAFDEASEVIRTVGNNMEVTYGRVESAGKALRTETESLNVSGREVALGFNNIATAGFSLVMGIERIEHAQVTLDRANLMVARSAEAVEKAQKAYNETVEKYGETSAEAKEAADRLAIAEEAHQVALERQNMSQNDLNRSMMTSALTVIPSLITMITSVSKVLEGLSSAKVANIAETISETAADVAATAAKAAHSVATGIQTAAEWLLNAATATQVALLTLGVGLVIAATAVAVFMAKAHADAAGSAANLNSSLGDLNATVDVTAESTKRLNEVLQENETVIEAASSANANAAKSQRDASDAVFDLGKKTLEYNDILHETTVTSGDFRTQSDDARRAGDELTKQIDSLRDSYEESKLSLDTQLSTLMDQKRAMESAGQTTGAYTGTYQRLCNEIQNTSDAFTRLTAGPMQGNIRTLTEQRDNLLALSEASKQHAELLDNLSTEYNLVRASADANLGAIKASFDKAFNAGDIKTATNLIADFAERYGITFEDAEKVIEDFNAKVAEVPETLEEQLVGKAQNDLQAFKDCAGGKFAGITAIGTDSMNTLVGDVNELLDRGLVGEAQDLIKAFQECSTNKAADMAESIQASMDEMTKNGITTVAELNKYATLEQWLGTIKRQAAEATTYLSTEEILALTNPEQLRAYKAATARYGIALESLQEGGIVTEPTVALIGEHGPEAVIPLVSAGSERSKPPVTVYVTLNVQGTLDRRGAEYAARLVADRLRNVIVEASSGSGSSTHKRIRLGTAMR